MPALPANILTPRKAAPPSIASAMLAKLARLCHTVGIKT
jgi:hypothetical protein